MPALLIICDLCDRIVESTIKEDGIWICTECAKKYPTAKTELINRVEKSC